jgi:hypothetical protein
MLQITERMILEGISSADFIKAISDSVESESISNMDSYINLFSEGCYKNEGFEGFPEDVFEVIILKIQDVKFQSLSDSHKLLYLFESDWGRLNESQKSILLDVINNTYLLFKDSLSYFTLSEIIGEYFADEKALKVLNNLRQTENEVARSFLTYGYGKLARNTSDENVKKSAIVNLQTLKNDKSNIVRDEATIALKKLRI